MASQLASSPREVAEAADVVLVMMADPVAALAVAHGPTGAVAGLSEGGPQPPPATAVLQQQVLGFRTGPARPPATAILQQKALGFMNGPVAASCNSRS